MRNIWIGLLVLGCGWGAATSWAQAPTKTPKLLWQSAVGGNGIDKATDFVVGTDGSYVIVAETRSTEIVGTSRDGVSAPRMDADVLVVKMNSKGRVLWKKLYGGTETDSPNAIALTKEGGYVIAGTTTSPELTRGGRDFYLIRLNKLGEMLWEKTYGGAGNEEAKDVIALDDGGFLLVGESSQRDGMVTSNRGGIDAWVIRVDAKGELIWQKNFGGRGNDRLAQALKLNERTVMLVGSTESDDGDALGNHGRVDILLLKIGLDGSLLWRKVMGGSLNDEGYGISRTHDGFFYVTGTTFSTDGDVSFNHGLGDVWLVKLNEKGDIVWEKTFGGSRSEGANAVITTFEGDALVVGTVSSSNQDVQLTYGKFDGWILKVDPRGNLIWERACGGSEKDEFFAVAEAPSGDYITVGYSNSDDYDLVSLQKNTGTDIYVASLTNPDDDRRATSLTPTVLMGYVRDALTGKFIKAEVALLDDNNLRTLYTGYTDTTYGIYQVLAPDTLRMSVGVFADGYMFTSRDVFITPNEKYGEVRLDFELKPFNKDSSFVLRNIEFDTGTQVLRDVSKIELNRLAAFLEKNPRMKIRIIGHTDSTGGNPEGKLILSKRRAISVKGYLVSIGIDKDRIETDGFGMSKPLVKEVTEEDRQLNRRVEIKLLVW